MEYYLKELLKLTKIILMIITINRRSMNSLLQFKKLNHKGFNKQDLSLLNKLSVFLFNKHNQYKFNKLKLFKFRKLENNYRVLHKYQTSFVNQFNIFKNEHLEHKFTELRKKKKRKISSMLLRFQSH